MKDRAATFRERLRAGDPLVGTFLKTPSSIVAEVLAQSTLDVFCIDTEHAPFGRLELDGTIGALRAADRPVIVRTADDSPREIRNALDSGANGILVPHVTSAEQAAAIATAAHFGEGGRGYAGSTRAAEFTRKSMAKHLDDSREQTTVIVQIEDLAALDAIADIAAVDGVDALFIGRVDLAVAMRKSVADAAVVEQVRRICEQARAAGVIVGLFTPSLDELPAWRDAGATLFLLGSDQSFMLDGADALATTFRR